jgi:hypothetical protein
MITRYLKPGVAALAAMCALACASAGAQAPQSDDWSSATLNSFWTYAPIGDNQGVESQSVKSNHLVVVAGGADVWTAPDNFVYVYQKASGDFRVTTKVDTGSLDAPSDVNAKAGLMLRSSEDDSAAYTYLFESPHRSGILWEMRQDDAGTNQSQSPNTQQLPAWLRLTRINGAIIPSYSSDGVHFFSSGQIADANQDSSVVTPVYGLPGLKNDPILVGIATTSHNVTIPATANYGAFVATAVQGGTISGTVTGADGKGLAGASVSLSSADGTDNMTVTTDADGKYSAPVVVGDWNVGVLSATGYALPVKVTVAANATATADVKLNALPAFTWTTDSTDTAVSAKLWADIGDANTVTATDWSPINPTFDEKSFSDVVVPEDEGGNTISNAPGFVNFWYRIHFKVPASFQAAKGNMLYLSGFNMDDSDITFVNGHYVGNTLNSWDAKRQYMVPSDFISWDGDNVIAILGTQGGGGAGFNKLVTDGYTPTLSMAAPTDAGVYGKAVTDKGGEVGGLAVTLKDASGASKSTTTSFVDGSYRFTGLKPGAYTLTVGTQPAASVTVESGKAAVAADTKVPSISNFGPADLAAVDVSKLKNVDISGNPDVGTLTVTGSNVTLNAGGADIWNNADDFSFAESPNHVTGDFTAVARAIPGLGSSDWSKAGIMVRASDAVGSQNVTALNSYYYGARLQYRDVTDGASNSLGNNLVNNLNNMIMLTRQGDTFSMYTANSDGSNATLIGQQTIAGFPKDLIIGLDATSHSLGTLVNTKFSDFSLSNTAWPASTGATLGDLNADGKVNVQDATTSLRIAVGSITPTDAQKAAGDVNHDGKWNVQDTTLILRFAVGAITVFP